MGPSALLAAAADALSRREKRVAWAAIGATVVLFGSSTFQRSSAFKSDLRLWRSAVQEQPDSAVARYQLAMYLLAEGRRPEAIDQLESMARVAREPALRARARSLWFLHQGRFGQAVSEAADAQRIRPDAGFTGDLARQLDRAGRHAEASELRELSRARPP